MERGLAKETQAGEKLDGVGEEGAVLGREWAVLED